MTAKDPDAEAQVAEHEEGEDGNTEDETELEPEHRSGI